jgi:hypothetical protein
VIDIIINLFGLWLGLCFLSFLFSIAIWALLGSVAILSILMQAGAGAVEWVKGKLA